MKITKKIWKLCLSLILVTILISCSNKNLPSNESISLKVVYWDNLTFNSDYGNFFQSKFPNIKFEVISIQHILNMENRNETFKKIVESENPDIIMIPDRYLYREMALSGKLSPVNINENEKLNKEYQNFSNSIIDMLLVENQLYGLSPSFTNLGLFYNKDLFNQFNFEYPVDNMDWKETFQIMSQFKDAGEISGFYSPLFSSNMSNLITVIGAAKELLYVNNELGEVTINTPNWLNIYKLVTDLYTEGVIYTGISDANLFLEGKSAITIDTASFIAELKENDTKFEWGIVSAPTELDKSSFLTVQEIFSINSISEYQKESLEIINFIHSEELAKIKSSSFPYTLYSQKLVEESDELSKFYIGNSTNSYLNDVSQIPVDFFRSLYLIQNHELERFMNGEISIEEALENIHMQIDIEFNK